MAVRPSHAALPLASAIWLSSTARARVRARPERPDRRNRRRQVHPGRGRRPAGRRPRVGRPRPDGRGRRGDRGDLREPDGREVIVRREISAQGRSRAFVNGALATSAALRDSRGVLVDLHGQHEHQSLLDPATHLDLLDAFAGARRRTRGRRRRRSRTWRDVARRARAAARRRAREGAARRVPDLSARRDRAGRAVKPGEDDELAATRQVLANADRLQRLCAEATTRSTRRRRRSCRRSASVWKRLGELAALDPRSRRTWTPRTASSRSSRTSRSSCRSYADGIDASPERLQEVEDRLALLERLKRKHGPTLDDVIAKAAIAAAGTARPRAGDRAGRGTRRRARGGPRRPI